MAIMMAIWIDERRRARPVVQGAGVAELVHVAVYSVGENFRQSCTVTPTGEV